MQIVFKHIFMSFDKAIKSYSTSIIILRHPWLNEKNELLNHELYKKKFLWKEYSVLFVHGYISYSPRIFFVLKSMLQIMDYYLKAYNSIYWQIYGFAFLDIYFVPLALW